MNSWEMFKAKAKAALENDERVYIRFPEMAEEIVMEWHAAGFSYKLVGVPGLPENFYEMHRD